VKQSKTRIKVCGITRLEDALCVESLGVDAIGFVFVAASKRAISVEAAADISAKLPPYMVRVGLFLNADREAVLAAQNAIPNLMPQFHGTESAVFCDSFNRPYVKALGVGQDLPTSEALKSFQLAQGFLFDSHAPGELGGTGHAFDWQRLSDGAPGRLILAGGLNPDNVASAIQQVRPYAVDVSSGVEQDKGVKDPAKLTAFVEAVEAADRSLS
jgi:phosphoribosylanthranilate isomerase